MLATLVGVATIVAVPMAQTAAQESLAQRIVHTDSSTYRPLTAVHAGAGDMAFAGLLDRGAIGPHFNFLHRGAIPAGSGIGHHFHNTVEEMFVILDGEAQFTIDGRTALIEGPAAVICRMGHSHAIYNSSSQTIQWMNFQASSIAGVSDAFDLGDDRVGAALDPVPSFMAVTLDRAEIRLADRAGRAAPAGPAERSGAQFRRVFGPPAFSSAWAYVDHVLVAPGATTAALTHDAIGEAYYVLAGTGTVSVGSETAPATKWDAIPVGLNETSSFSNTGSEPLELLVMGVAKDMNTKIQFMSGGNRRP
ncbi:MAG: cupin domain-containing protein [SAR202 cluster bacterium]|nr:cupin domain-containing protein [SAR202 cluster bacterium]